MAVIVVAEREIHARIVYYGPGLSGKTTNLLWLHSQLPEDQRSPLVSIDSGGERTLYFDFLPVSIGELGGFRLRLHLYTVPGQNELRATRATLLRGVDGIVFVVDAQRDRIADNEQSLVELEQSLKRQGRALADLPMVLQYNKSDLATALPRAQLDARYNPGNLPAIDAAALTGHGVAETLRLMLHHLLPRL